MSEIKFSDGMPVRERRSSTSIYPEELLDKKCGGCMRCQPRKRKGETGYRCTTQPYTKDISPEDKACVIYWDKEEERKYNALKTQDEENRRKELWNIYSKREPIKLPIVNDGYGIIPEWIPVSERFPESSGTYQVTCMDGRIYRSTYAKFQSRLKRWELTGARAYWKVTAWRPLPEPYKED